MNQNWDPHPESTSTEDYPRKHLAQQYPIVQRLRQDFSHPSFLCQQNSSPVVQKTFSAPFLKDKSGFETRLRELARLSHPHLGLILDFGWENQRAFLIREFAAGTPLLEGITKFTAESIFKLFAKILGVLAELHQNGLSHLRLKSENIFLESSPDLDAASFKIVDFGFNFIDADTESPFAPPPHWLASQEDPSRDLYAFAELLRAAFQTIRAPFPKNAKLEEFLQKTQHLDPKKRFESTREAEDFFRTASGLAPSSAPHFLPLELEEKYIQIFRKIAIQGNHWEIQGPEGSGKSAFSRWLVGLLRKHSKKVCFLTGSDLALITGENPTSPWNFAIIDDAEKGPIAAWIQRNPYPHQIVFSEKNLKLPTAKTTLHFEKSPKSDRENAKSFAACSPPQQEILSGLHLAAGPLPLRLLASLSATPAETLAPQLRALDRGLLERSVGWGEEYFESSQKIKFPHHFSASTLNLWFQTLKDAGFLSASLNFLEKILAASPSNRSLIDKAEIFAEQENYSAVLSTLKSSVVKTFSSSEQAQALEILAPAWAAWGNLSQAENGLKKAFQIYRDQKEVVGQARVLYHLGNIYRQNQDISKALKFLGQAFNLQDKIPAAILRKIVCSIAQTYSQASDFDHAAEYFQKAFADIHPPEFSRDEAQAWLAYAEFLLRQGQGENSEAYLQASLQSSLLRRDWSQAGHVQLLAAHLEMTRENPVQAFGKASEALWFFEKVPHELGQAQALLFRATRRIFNGERYKAERDVQTALSLSRKIKSASLMAEALFLLGKIHRLSPQTEAEAVKNFDQALQFLKDRSTPWLWELYFEKAEFYKSQGQKKTAQEFYQAALTNLDLYLETLSAFEVELFLKDRKREFLEEEIEAL